MPLDEYESARPGRRGHMELVLSRQRREEILIEWGATFTEIIDSIRANIRAKNQRRRTVQNLGTYDRWEEAMESASRKLKRTLLLQKPSGKRAEQLLTKLHSGGNVTYRMVHTHVQPLSHERGLSHSLVDQSHKGRISETHQHRRPDSLVPKLMPPSGSRSSLEELLHEDQPRHNHSQSSGGPPCMPRRRPSRSRQTQQQHHHHHQQQTSRVVLTEPMASADSELQALGVDQGDVSNAQYQHRATTTCLTAEQRDHLEWLERSRDSLPVFEVDIADQQSFMSEDGSWRLTSSIVDGEEYFYRSAGSFNDDIDDGGDDYLEHCRLPYEFVTNAGVPPVYHYVDESTGLFVPLSQEFWRSPIFRPFNAQAPIVISEDAGPFGGWDIPLEDDGFTMQPPPFSNTLICKWE